MSKKILKRHISEYVKLESPFDQMREHGNYDYTVAMVRRADYPTLEAALKDGAVYELDNCLSREEVLEGMEFARTAAGMFDENNGGIDFYLADLTAPEVLSITNFYGCTNCGYAWRLNASSAHDDRCQECDHSMQPYFSEEG